MRDEVAAQQLFRRYAQRLTVLAEQHLSRRVAQRVAGEDIVQSVFRSFFRRSEDGQFQIDDSAEMWKLLVSITLNKTKMKARFHSRKRRSVQAEQPAAADDDWQVQAVSSEPTPEEAAALIDEIEATLQGLPEDYCRMLMMRLEGHTPTEIAKEMEVSRQTIYRALNMMQDRMKKRTAESGDS